MTALSDAIDRFHEAKTDLENLVDATFPHETVVWSTRQDQFAIVAGTKSVSQSANVFVLLEHEDTREWFVGELEPVADRKKWPTWVKRMLTARKRRRTQRLKEYGRVTGELR